MSRIEEIINDLISEQISLEIPFLKAKVLLYEIDNKEILAWINAELKGYEVNEVPSYRTIPASLIGDLSNGYQRYHNASIPIMHLSKKMMQFFSTTTLPHSLSGLEHLISNLDGNDFLVCQMPLETLSVVNSNIPTNGYNVESCHLRVPKASVKTMISTIRSKMLDFMLEVKKEFGSEIGVQVDKEEIEKIFTATIIGDNNVILSGNQNKQKIAISNSKGNLQELETALKNSKMPLEDIEEIKAIVVQDDISNKKTFSPVVKSWMKKMAAKSLDGVWKIGISVAGKVMEDAIKNYYGF